MRPDNYWVVAMGFLLATWFATDTIMWILLSILGFGCMIIYVVMSVKQWKLDALKRLEMVKRWEVVLKSLYDIEEKLERLENGRRKAKK